MAIEGEYEESPAKWVRDQVEKYETSGGTAGTTLQGKPVVVITMKGAKSGKIRKVPLMRVEHDGVYAIVASQGGAPTNPVWYNNLVADPNVEVRDETEAWPAVAREVFGAERQLWWERSVEAWPAYADYQKKTDRLIPVWVLEKRD